MSSNSCRGRPPYTARTSGSHGTLILYICYTTDSTVECTTNDHDLNSRVANRGQYVGIRLWHPRARSLIRLWTKPRLISVVVGFGLYCSCIGRLQAVPFNYSVTDNATVQVNAVSSLTYISGMHITTTS
jgi:hypothetical protein